VLKKSVVKADGFARYIRGEMGMRQRKGGVAVLAEASDLAGFIFDEGALSRRATLKAARSRLIGRYGAEKLKRPLYRENQTVVAAITEIGRIALVICRAAGNGRDTAQDAFVNVGSYGSALLHSKRWARKQSVVHLLSRPLGGGRSEFFRPVAEAAGPGERRASRSIGATIG
jgi:hypothetical protein